MIDRRHTNILLASSLLAPWVAPTQAAAATTTTDPLPMPFDNSPIPPALPDSFADEARLVRALARLKSGGKLKVAALGGSITTGYAANPPEERGWAGLTAAWLQAMAKASGGQLEFINLGVSGTDSAAGVQRLEVQAIDTKVDLLIVEFGVNDQWLDTRVRARSYEGLLRQMLQAAHQPAVMTLHLTQQGGTAREATKTHLAIVNHHGLARVDFMAWVKAQALDWNKLYNEPVHPNATGHQAIARAVCSVLAKAWSLPAPATVAPLPAPLRDHEYESVRSFAGKTTVVDGAPNGGNGLQVLARKGFTKGGDLHPDWERRPGGQAEGWTTNSDDAELDLMVRGRQILLMHPESENYRNLEAWVDDGPKVTIQCHNPIRTGYLGWVVVPVALDLEDDLHLLRIRVKADEWAGSGRTASITAVHTAGIKGKAVNRFVHFDDATDGPDRELKTLLGNDKGLVFYPASQRENFRLVTRVDPDVPDIPLLAWTNAQVRARFTGTRLGLRMQGLNGQIWFNVTIDGQTQRLNLVSGSTQDYVLKRALPEGEHEVVISKRTEANSTQGRFHGLLLAPEGRLLAAPPERALRIELYGDSISAGACNGDVAADQYDDLSTHDGTRSYGAVAARILDADYLGIAVSGIGIAASWGDGERMPEVFDRILPFTSSSRAPAMLPGQRQPDVIVVNLGQNDFGWPSSQGKPFPSDYRSRYVAMVKALRARHPKARIICALGGMSGWKASPDLLQSWKDAVTELKSQDTMIWGLQFQAYTDAHPRIDTHAKLGKELADFLQTQVLSARS